MAYRPGAKVGYLGGGQLARLLAMSAHHLGIEPHVFCKSPHDPAAQVVRHFHAGEINDTLALRRFIDSVDYLTFESEFVDIELLKKSLFNSNIIIAPQAELMKSWQDRRTQKNLLDQYGLKTAPWRDVSKTDLLDLAMKELGLPLVFKKRLGGYDGYGTFVVRTREELSKFKDEHFEEDLFIAEKFIAFERELAVIVARSRDGSTTHLPWVESQQTQSRCDWVKGPIKISNGKNIIQSIFKMLTDLDYVGVMGVEFFQGQRQTLINEIAPRVHNTGHYSLSLPGYNQFDLHNLAIIGEPLPPPPKVQQGFAMANLIGTGEELHFKTTDQLFWYGKKDNIPGRKMGHVNSVGETPEKALKQVLKKRQELGL